MSTAFAMELARWGPGSQSRPVSQAQARAYCRRFTLSQYENFSVVSVLLPRRLLRHFYAIYAYCRWADNLGDETGGGARALELLRWWREELLRCYNGRPRHPVMVALAGTVRRFHIPPQPFLDLLFAFEQDQLVKRYHTFGQLLDYCRYSANPVGHLVLYLFECFDIRRAALSDKICTALQLTNFWQDVARDYALGRVYLPEEDCRRFGYGESDLTARRYNRAFVNLMRFEVERARDLFFRGLPLLDLVPDAVRVDVELFARGGLEVLVRIERLDYNVWHHRPTLAKWQKAALFAGAVWRHWRSRVWPEPTRPAGNPLAAEV
jgi:squalene synthase HpnC